MQQHCELDRSCRCCCCCCRLKQIVDGARMTTHSPREGGRPTALYTCVRIADKEQCLSADRPTTAQSETNSRRVSYQGLYIDTCPFIIVCFFQTLIYIILYFIFVVPIFFSIIFISLAFPPPFPKKKKKKKPFIFLFFSFSALYCEVSLQEESKNNYGKNNNNNNKLWQKVHLFLYLGGNKYFKSSPSSMYVYIHV